MRIQRKEKGKMIENNKNTPSGAGALICGIVGIVLSVIGFFVFGWLNIVSVVLGLVACCLPAPSMGYKTTGILSLVMGAIGSILWLMLVMALV